jgi:hypothetical protein
MISPLTPLVTAISGEDNDARTAAEEMLTQFRESTYGQYLSDWLDLLTSCDSRLLPIACTYLFVEARTKRLFDDIGLLGEFLARLVPAIPDLLDCDIQANFKGLLMEILSRASLFMFQSGGDTSLQRVLLQLHDERRDLECHVIECIANCVLHDDHCAGFEAADLIRILTEDPEFAGAYRERVHLFFAIARRFPGDSDLSGFFPTLLVAMPRDPIGFLAAFIDFVETDAIFVLPHLDVVIGRLCDVAADVNAAVHARNLAMLSFSAMAQGAVEMCQCSPEFYERVFEVLIQIAAQVPEEDEEEGDDEPPCRLALKVLNLIFFFAGNDDYFRCIEAMREAAMTQDAPWAVCYAFLSVYAEMDGDTFAADRNEFIEGMLGYIGTHIHPRIRTAALEVIDRVLEDSWGSLAMDLSARLLEQIQALIGAESNLRIQSKLFDVFATFFESLHRSGRGRELAEALFPESFQFAVTACRSIAEAGTQLELLPSLIQVIGVFSSVVQEPFLEHFQSTTQLLNGLLQLQSIDIDLQAVTAFSMMAANPTLADLVRPLGSQLVSLAWALRGSASSEDDLDLAKTALDTLISAIRPLPADTYSMMMVTLSAEASKEIEITEVPGFCDTLFSDSMYTKLPSLTTQKIYASTAAVREISRALGLIHTIESVVGVHFEPFLAVVVPIVTHWIGNDYAIEPLKNDAWRILSLSVKLFPSPELAHEVVSNGLRLNARVDPPAELSCRLGCVRQAASVLVSSDSADAPLFEASRLPPAATERAGRGETDEVLAPRAVPGCPRQQHTIAPPGLRDRGNLANLRVVLRTASGAFRPIPRRRFPRAMSRVHHNPSRPLARLRPPREFHHRVRPPEARDGADRRSHRGGRHRAPRLQRTNFPHSRAST